MSLVHTIFLLLHIIAHIFIIVLIAGLALLLNDLFSQKALVSGSPQK